MINIVIITHGSLSESLLESAAMFASNTEGVRAIAFYPGQGVEELVLAIREVMRQMPSQDGFLALVDLPGGSPARAAGTIVAESAGPLEVVSGVNLPMLVEALLLRDSMPLSELADYAIASGNDGIVNVGKILRGYDPE